MSSESEHLTPQAKRSMSVAKAPLVIWFTGLSGAGKTTLASGLEKILVAKGLQVFQLDGDRLRSGLNSDLGFSPQDREENIRRAAEVSAMMCDAGLIVLASFITPYQKDRNRARQIIGGKRFVEVYLECSLDVCMQRDVKGLYKKAAAGEIKQFTGLSAPYETPENPDLTLATGVHSIESCLQILEQAVLSRIPLVS